MADCKTLIPACYKNLRESFIKVFHQASAGRVVFDEFVDGVKVIESHEQNFRRSFGHRQLVLDCHRHQVKQLVHGRYDGDD